MAESLENRMVLSVAPVDESVGPSLAEYLAEDHEMGPMAPAEVAASDASTFDDTAALNSITFLPRAEGEGDGEGSSSGQGSAGGQGSGGSSASGSGGGSGQGSGSGAGSGGGEGSGSGAGSGSGQGSSSGSEDPTVSSVSFSDDDDGTITVNGTVLDDGDMTGITITLGIASGDVTLNSDGTFSINITDTNGNSSFQINVTDADGNTTTYTFDFPT